MTGPFLTFFPQFCREPLNDAAWYPGFTDWDLIRQVPEPFRHRFTPAAGFYDLADERCISGELMAVAASAWPAMALYQYFFDGRFALDAVERYIASGASQVPRFFVIWANETWSKRWIGKPQSIIIRQKHSRDRPVVDAHVRRLTKLFGHPSYAREKGRPIFVIYAAFDVPQICTLVRTYREAFAGAGEDPLIGFCVPYLDPGFDASEFDFSVEFQPRLFFNVMRSRSQSTRAAAGLVLKRWAPAAFDHLTGIRDLARRRRSQPSVSFRYQDYLELLEQDYFSTALERTYGKPAYRSLFFSWNNFPRYRGSAVQVTHRRDDYATFMRLCERFRASERWFLVNSWNEWSEGAALEPGLIKPDLFEVVA